MAGRTTGGWADAEWKDVWMDARMLGWTDGCLERTDAQVDGRSDDGDRRTDGWPDRWTGGGQTDAQMDGRATGGWADAGWMNVRMGARVLGWTDARMDV